MRTRPILTAFGYVLATSACLALVGCAPLLGEEEQDCSVLAQNQHAKELMQDVYLWADSVPDVDPSKYASPAEVVAAMRNQQFDHWSGVSNAGPRQNYFDKGEFFGIGYQAVGDTAGNVRLSFVHPDSPAALAGLMRGDTLLEINGKTTAQINAEQLWGSIEGPNEKGFAVPYKVRRASGEVVDLIVLKDTVVIRTVAVKNVFTQGADKVAYLLFTGFLGTSDKDLREAFAELKPLGITKFILDLRYNGGGFVSVATDLASLIVGPPGVGKPFTILAHNKKYASEDTVTFLHEEPEALSGTELVALTGPGTASASELLLNGLRPLMNVRLVGAPTHGKPVGGSTWTRCELAVSPITFRTLNGEGMGDYFGGLMPDCTVPDDLDHSLGDPEESRLKVALGLLRGEACPAPPEQQLKQLRSSGPAHGLAPITRGPEDPFGIF
ncbi:MAG: S41 family peptidase [Polyangiaceae bacterium]|nr:S41 family peptidase [Polyangiaceae bacterium]